MKRCTKCGREQPVEDFKLVRKSDGRTYRRGACDSCRLAALAAYNAERIADRAAWNEYNRNRYVATRERVLERMRDKRRVDPRLRQRDREHYYRNRTARIAAQERYNLARRARKNAVEHEPWTRREIFHRDGGVCQLCTIELKLDGTYHIDHIVLISQGGPDVRSNLRLLCASCNLRRPKK